MISWIPLWEVIRHYTERLLGVKKTLFLLSQSTRPLAFTEQEGSNELPTELVSGSKLD